MFVCGRATVEDSAPMATAPVTSKLFNGAVDPIPTLPNTCKFPRGFVVPIPTLPLKYAELARGRGVNGGTPKADDPNTESGTRGFVVPIPTLPVTMTPLVETSLTLLPVR